MSVDPKSEYYSKGDIETIDIIKAKLTKEQYKGYLLGNIIKYSCRAEWKGSFNRDIEKIAVYTELLKKANLDNKLSKCNECQYDCIIHDLESFDSKNCLQFISKENKQMVYKDMTFCSFYKECKDRYMCDRKLTPSIIDYAKVKGLPISQFMEKPECFMEDNYQAEKKWERNPEYVGL